MAPSSQAFSPSSRTSLNTPNERAYTLSQREAEVERTLVRCVEGTRRLLGLPHPILENVIRNGRALSWGTLLPLRGHELELHTSYCNGLKVDLSSTNGHTRPIHRIAKVTLGNELRISALVVHPCIATMTVTSLDLGIEDFNRMQCEVSIFDPPSSGTVKCSYNRLNTGLCEIRGRIAGLLAERSYADLDCPLGTVIYVNLSSSSLMFLVSLPGAAYLCSTTASTLDIMSRCASSVADSLVKRGTLYVYNWGGRKAPKDCHMKIGTGGSMTLVGHPNSVEGIAASVLRMVQTSLSTPDNSLRLLSTLQVARVIYEP